MAGVSLTAGTAVLATSYVLLAPIVTIPWAPLFGWTAWMDRSTGYCGWVQALPFAAHATGWYTVHTMSFGPVLPDSRREVETWPVHAVHRCGTRLRPLPRDILAEQQDLLVLALSGARALQGCVGFHWAAAFFEDRLLHLP